MDLKLAITRLHFIFSCTVNRISKFGTDPFVSPASSPVAGWCTALWPGRHYRLSSWSRSLSARYRNVWGKDGEEMLAIWVILGMAFGFMEKL